MSQLKNLNSINAKKPTFPTNPHSPICTRRATGRSALHKHKKSGALSVPLILREKSVD